MATHTVNLNAFLHATVHLGNSIADDWLGPRSAVIHSTIYNMSL